MATRLRAAIDEEAVLGGIDENFRGVKTLLESLGFEVTSLRKLSEAELSRVKLLIIPGKHDYKFLASEVRTLLDSVLRGLNVLIMLDAGGDCGSNTNLQEVLEPLGIYIRCDTAKGEGRTEFEIPVEESHPMLEDVLKVRYVNGCTLLLKRRVTTEVVLRTPESASPSKVPVIVATRYGNGRVVISGSYKMFEDGILDADNARLLANIIMWLTRLSIGTAEIEDAVAKAVSVTPVTRPPERVVQPTPPAPIAVPETTLEGAPERVEVTEFKPPSSAEMQKEEHISLEELVELAPEEIERILPPSVEQAIPAQQPSPITVGEERAAKEPSLAPEAVVARAETLPEAKIAERKLEKPRAEAIIARELAKEVEEFRSMLGHIINQVATTTQAIYEAGRTLVEALEALKAKLEKMDERLREIASKLEG